LLCALSETPYVVSYIRAEFSREPDKPEKYFWKGRPKRAKQVYRRIS